MFLGIVFQVASCTMADSSNTWVSSVVRMTLGLFRPLVLSGPPKLRPRIVVRMPLLGIRRWETIR